MQFIGSLRSRRSLLLGAMAGSGALALGVAPSAGLGAPTDEDYAWAQLAVAAGFLLADVYTKAIASRSFTGVELKGLRRARFNAGEHVVAFSRILSDGGLQAAVAEDFEFAYPARGFERRSSIARLAAGIQSATLGAYLGAVVAVTQASFRTVFARASANVAEHLSLTSGIAYERPVGISFPEALRLEEASDRLDVYFG